MPKTAMDPVAGDGNINPIRVMKQITPSDSDDLKVASRVIKIGNTSGNLVYLNMDENDDTKWETMPVRAGDWLVMMVRRIGASSTCGTIHVGY